MNTTRTKIAMACTGLALLGLAGCKPADEAPPPPKVASAPGEISFAAGAPALDSLEQVGVLQGPLPISADLNARLAVDEAVTGRVGAPVAARVTALLADVGDKVRAGQPLARVDAPDLAQANADLVESASTADLKGRAAARARELFAGGAIAQRDLESAAADQRSAAAELARARQRLQSLGGGGGGGTGLALAAPVAGIVLDRQLEPGQQLSAGQGPLFTVTDPTRLWLLLDAPETVIGRLRVGQQLGFEVDAFPGRRFAARVQKIGLAVDPATRRIQVRATVANPGLELKPEMFARARLETDDGRLGLKVPNAALFERGMASYVFRRVAPGRFRRVPVTVAVRGEQASWVSAGLQPGDVVVGQGALLLAAQLGDQ